MIYLLINGGGFTVVRYAIDGQILQNHTSLYERTTIASVYKSMSNSPNRQWSRVTVAPFNRQQFP